MIKAWIKFLAAAVFSLLLLCSCSRDMTEQENSPYTVSFFAMDTYMEIRVYGERAKEAAEAAQAEILRLDGLLSVSSESGDVAKINSFGEGKLSGDTAALLEMSLELYENTGGAFDVTVGPVMELWGFRDGNYRVPSSEELSQVLPLVDSEKIDYGSAERTVKLGEGQKIDFGGIAKGFASDRTAEILRNAGVSSAWISLGGNVQTVGGKPDHSRWRIGIRDPKGSAESYLAVVSVENQAVITSGNYERYFIDEETGKRYHHIIDPSDGLPSDNGLASVTIVSDSGVLADGLSTSLFVLGVEKGADYWREHRGEFQAVFVTEDGKIYITEGLEACFTSDREYEVIR